MNRPRLLCVAVLALGCRRTGSRPATDAAAPSLRETIGRYAPLVERLSDSDEQRREKALKELRALDAKHVGEPEALFFLHAASRKYPAAKAGSTEAELIRIAARHPSPAQVPIVRQIFFDLEDEPRSEALALLGVIDDERAATTLVELVEAAVAKGKAPRLSLARLEARPHHADIFFPRLLSSAKGASAWGIYSLCLSFAQKRALEPATLAPRAPMLVAAFEPLRGRLLAAQAKAHGSDWLWDDDYVDVRERAGLLLDLMGYFPTPAIERILTDGCSFKDPRLAAFAAGSLLRLGGNPPRSVFERAAADTQTRSWLFDELARQGKPQLFPARWRTQRALAEAEMVRWLIYPTELDRAPDEIQLMKIVADDVGPPDGVMEWYLFRFRTRPPHWAAKHGWMAGVAGPFKKSEEPTTRSEGETFSDFEPWNSRSVDDHVRKIRERIEDWRTNNDD